MKKPLFVLLIALISSAAGFSQSATDTALNIRLNEYMRLTRELKLEQLMDYMHPKIFELATREQMIRVLSRSYNNDDIAIAFDSTAITGISEDFQLREARYKKVDYWMGLTVFFKDTAALNNRDFIKTMTTSFMNAFPGSSVSFDERRKKFVIQASTFLMAIKDTPSSQWMFLGSKKNDVLIRTLYPKEVVDHFKL